MYRNILISCAAIGISCGILNDPIRTGFLTFGISSLLFLIRDFLENSK